MSALYSWAYRFGAFVERRKTVLLSTAFLAIALTALTLSMFVPSFGYSLFSPFCHQNPEHTFGTLPLCSRCFGLYIGFGLAGLFLPVFSLRISRGFLTVGIAASLALAALSFFSSVLDGNYLRIILGVAVGASFALLIKSILK